MSHISKLISANVEIYKRLFSQLIFAYTHTHCVRTWRCTYSMHQNGWPLHFQTELRCTLFYITKLKCLIALTHRCDWHCYKRTWIENQAHCGCFNIKNFTEKHGSLHRWMCSIKWEIQLSTRTDLKTIIVNVVIYDGWSFGGCE